MHVDHALGNRTGKNRNSNPHTTMLDKNTCKKSHFGITFE